MRVGEVVVDADQAVVFPGVAFVGGDQIPGSVPIVGAIRRRKQCEEWRYAGINAQRNAIVWSGAVAGSRVVGRGQQALMSKRIGHRSNCRGCPHFTEPLIVYKKEGAVMRQRPSDSSSELVAHKCRNRGPAQIKVVPGVERSISMQFEQRSMEMIRS